MSYLTPTIWSQQYHSTRWKHYRWDQHTKNTNIPNQQHFSMWKHKPVTEILSCHNGIPYNINMVQIHRIWLLPRVFKPHINKITPPHQSHNRDINGSHGPTNTKEYAPQNSPPSPTQMTTGHLYNKLKPMTIHVTYTWKSPISITSSTLIKQVASQSHQVEAIFMFSYFIQYTETT